MFNQRQSDAMRSLHKSPAALSRSAASRRVSLVSATSTSTSIDDLRRRTLITTVLPPPTVVCDLDLSIHDLQKVTVSSGPGSEYL